MHRSVRLKLEICVVLVDCRVDDDTNKSFVHIHHIEIFVVHGIASVAFENGGISFLFVASAKCEYAREKQNEGDNCRDYSSGCLFHFSSLLVNS